MEMAETMERVARDDFYETRGKTVQSKYTEQELKDWKKEYAGNATEEQFRLWIADCERRNLVPVRDVVLQVRRVSEYDPAVRAKVYKTKAVHITTIGAFRKIAERTGKYGGQLPSTWIYLNAEGMPTLESGVPLPDMGSTIIVRQPWAVRVAVKRNDFDQPTVVVARFWAYAQTLSEGGLTAMWANRGPEQLEKCGLALALRAAFPEDLGGLYIQEEFSEREFRDDAEDKTEQTASTGAVQPPSVPVPPSVPKVQQTPASPSAPDANPVSGQHYQATDADLPEILTTSSANADAVKSNTKDANSDNNLTNSAGNVPNEGSDSGGDPNATAPAMPTRQQKDAFIKFVKDSIITPLKNEGVDKAKDKVGNFIRGYAGVESTNNLTAKQMADVSLVLENAVKSGNVKNIVCNS